MSSSRFGPNGDNGLKNATMHSAVLPRALSAPGTGSGGRRGRMGTAIVPAYALYGGSKQHGLFYHDHKNCDFEYPYHYYTQYKYQHHNDEQPEQALPHPQPLRGRKWIKRLTQDRLSQFNGGTLTMWSAPGLLKPSFAEALSHRADFKPAKKGDAFGPSWTNHWWLVHLVFPEGEFEGEERVTFGPGHHYDLAHTSLSAPITRNVRFLVAAHRPEPLLG
ncbi:hypothetical protein B0H16DRAFT_1688449 [Mycena metata]|uniref:Alpha-mannosidase Ams1-like N-terminal domain-containing protein n=1 Tax=Mycena metata TaxID=1033252 RepID=A0AAD7JDU9_9AGAR|nr:hypothetical protein B0H16DRAFT_1688449 [Mycena metata]